MGKEKTLSPEVAKARLSHLRDNYEALNKATNYILVAHGAGLVGCLSTLKDYAATPQLKGVGVFIVIFGTGLIAAIIAYITASMARMEVMAALTDRQSPPMFVLGLSTVASASSLLSIILLIIAIIILMIKFASL